MGERSSGSLPGRVAAIAVVAIALAYIEASVVVYLRQVILPIRQKHFPEAAGEALPLLSAQQLVDAGADYVHLLFVELAREPAPLALLLAVAWALRRRKGEVLGFFLLGFGLWDILYYVFLKVAIDWPVSLTTWDVLYLIPIAWVAPVWAPVVVSATMVVAGLGILHSGRDRKVRRGPAASWLVILAGMALVLASFFTRSGEALSRAPKTYDWPMFLGGWLLGVIGLVWLLWPRPEGPIIRPSRRGP